jgi:hypothetical protein
MEYLRDEDGRYLQSRCRSCGALYFGFH